MFSNLQHMSSVPNDADIAAQTLKEEGTYRFPSFSSNDAITLGLSIRKRFRSTTRHAKGKGLVLSIQTSGGHTLFSCTVGDLGSTTGVGDVSLDSWACLEGMINVVRRTGHSSYYVEKGMSAMGKTPKQMHIQGDSFRVNGGAFPVWLENAPCCPIAIIAAYSGSSQEDHTLVSTTIRDYLAKIRRDSEVPYTRMPEPQMSELPPDPPPRDHHQEWREPPSEYDQRAQSPFTNV